MWKRRKINKTNNLVHENSAKASKPAGILKTTEKKEKRFVVYCVNVNDRYYIVRAFFTKSVRSRNGRENI